MSEQGLPEDAFLEAVADELAGCMLFSYFPSFQQAFLGQVNVMEPVYDLPLLVRAAESHLVFPDELFEKDLASVEYELMTKYHIARPKWKSFLESHSLPASEFGMLPAESNAEALLKAWDLLKA